MKHFNHFILCIIFFGFSALHAQTKEQKETIIAHTNVNALADFSQKSYNDLRENRANALILANLLGWEKIIETSDSYSELVGVTKNNRPIYYMTYNRGAGETIKATKLYTGGGLGLDIHGENMVMGIWDSGTVFDEHEIYENRVSIMEGSPGSTNHATHVGGTMIGSDQVEDGEARGMAFEAHLNSYDWSDDITEVAQAAAAGLLFSNHSYGYNPNFVDIYQWGKYDTESQAFDEIMFNAPYYQFVCAAGNTRNDNINTDKGGYDLVSGHALAKNGITVAAVEEVTTYNSPADVIMSVFSSWGGSDDGRIKPDIAAKGVQTYSAINGVGAYGFYNGTSMAAPSVTGGLSLLQQHYNNLNASFMRAATLKGLMIHTADEAGAADGPDYQFGWGLMNLERAANLITNNGVSSTITEAELSNQSSYSFTVIAIPMETLSATLIWTDPAAEPSSLVIDDTTPMLVNDLDIRITKADETFLPWKLDISSPAAAATHGDNLVDNVEKIDIPNASGVYTITISHKGNLLNDLQHYSLLLSGITFNDFWFTTDEENIAACETDNTATFTFDLIRSTDSSEDIIFSATNLPSAVNAVFTPVSLNETGAFEMTLDGISTLATGGYPITVWANSDEEEFESMVFLSIFNDGPVSISPVFPEDNALNLDTSLVFQWETSINSNSYDFELATDFLFTNIIFSETSQDTNLLVDNLNYNTEYFWRVKGNNPCGNSDFSTGSSFFTLCFSPPSDINIIAATASSVTIDWVNESDANSWEIEIIPYGAAPTGIGNVTSDKPYTFTNLASLSSYDIYIRFICENSLSNWSTVTTITTPPDYCNGDRFYDSGGIDDDYQDNENITTTIFPNNQGDFVTAIFYAFNTENGFDYLNVYDGPDDSYPLITALSGELSNIDPIASTHETGALTFVFTSDGSVTRSGWDVTFICQPLPSCAATISAVELEYASTSSLTMSWLDTIDVTSWEVALLPEGVFPTEGIITDDNPYTFEGLESNTTYHFYIRSICGEGTSIWTGPLVFNTHLDYCNGDRFYDSGGINDNYQSNENITTTIFPENAGDHIIAVFNDFNIEANDDFLRVYDGPNDSYPLVAELTGNIDVTSIPATDEASGALTFVFSSDGFSTRPGWDISIICASFPNCPYSLSNIALLHSSTTSLTVTWADSADVNSWELVLLPEGASPDEGIITADNPYTFEGLEANTAYHFYIRSLCEAGISAWLGPFALNTQPDYCSGDRFYDSGGIDDDYQNNENITTTIFPDNQGDFVTAIFYAFNTESGFDYLNIYDGPDDSYPLITILNGDLPNIDPIASTHETGALTFVFTSDGSVTRSGWDVTFICQPLPSCAATISAIELEHASTSSLTIGWLDVADITSWEITLVAEGAVPGELLTTSDNPYTFEGLEVNTAYHFYIRSICGEGTSVWMGPVSLSTQTDYCNGDRFYDSGGFNDNYQSNENITTTIFPENAGDHIIAVFNDFNIEANDDFLRVYDGPNDSYPLVAELTGNIDVADIPATDQASGALTFVFTSDNFSTRSGWDISIICEPFPDCPYSLSDIALLDPSTTSLTVTWADSAEVNSWELALLPEGASPAEGIITTDNPYTFEGLEANTTYHFYIRSLCEAGTSAWFGPFVLSTLPDYCNGDRFYDSGGFNDNYQNNENMTTTIFPENAGDHIIAVFNDFNIGENNDFLRVYDGPNDSYPLVVELTGNIDVADIPATDQASGALTFVFTSNDFSTRPGWDISIICEPFPDCPYSLSDIALLDPSTTSLTVTWADIAEVNAWELVLLPEGVSPAEGIIIADNPYTFEGLESNTTYHFYIRSLCEAGTSAWFGPFVLSTLPDYCNGDRFYDSGGFNDNYQNNENITTTIFPENAGDHIIAVFNDFNIEANDDFLRIYDGPNDSYPLVAELTGNIDVADIPATDEASGALTFVFISDGFSTRPGWDISIICEPFPDCPYSLSDILFIDRSSSSLTATWADIDEVNAWELVLLPEGVSPAEGIIIADNPYTFEGLESNTTYHFYIRSLCEAGTSAWFGPFVLSTLPDYCNGDRFYDSGGLSSFYQNNENITTTIFPENSEGFVTAVFYDFNTEDGFDYLIIYDGPDDSYPLITTLTGYLPDIDPIASTHETGALTFVFTSDPSVTRSGWDAVIECITTDTEDIPSAENVLTYFPNPVSALLTVRSEVEISQLYVYDFTGKLLQTLKQLNTRQFNVNMADYPAGMYYFKAKSSRGKWYAFKVIKGD